MSDSVRPHRRQPTRLPRPWDSPGKNTGVGCQCLLCDYPEIIEKNHMEVGSFLSLKDPLFLCYDFIYCFVFLNRLCYEEWFRFTTKCVEVQKLFSDLLPAHKHSLSPSPTFPCAMWSKGLELDVSEGLLFHPLQHPLASTISLSFVHVVECLSSLLLLCWAVFWQTYTVVLPFCWWTFGLSPVFGYYE